MPLAYRRKACLCLHWIFTAFNQVTIVTCNDWEMSFLKISQLFFTLCYTRNKYRSTCIFITQEQLSHPVTSIHLFTYLSSVSYECYSRQVTTVLFNLIKLSTSQSGSKGDSTNAGWKETYSTVPWITANKTGLDLLGNETPLHIPNQVTVITKAQC